MILSIGKAKGWTELLVLTGDIKWYNEAYRFLKKIMHTL